jgi:hypothetical protein
VAIESSADFVTLAMFAKSKLVSKSGVGRVGPFYDAASASYSTVEGSTMIYKVSATVEALQEGKPFDEVFHDGDGKPANPENTTCSPSSVAYPYSIPY